MKLESGEIVSATQVRKLLLADEWAEIERYVPQCVLDRLRGLGGTVRYRIAEAEKELAREAEKKCDYPHMKLNQLVDRIAGLEKVVVYTVGRDMRKLLERLPEEIVERLKFCDKSAGEGVF